MKYKINIGLIKNKDRKMITIIDTEKSLIYDLNETATLVYEGIYKGKDEKTLINLLSSKYKVDVKQIKKDVELIIDDFLKKKIIVPLKQSKLQK